MAEPGRVTACARRVEFDGAESDSRSSDMTSAVDTAWVRSVAFRGPAAEPRGAALRKPGASVTRGAVTPSWKGQGCPEAVDSSGKSMTLTFLLNQLVVLFSFLALCADSKRLSHQTCYLTSILQHRLITFYNLMQIYVILCCYTYNVQIVYVCVCVCSVIDEGVGFVSDETFLTPLLSRSGRNERRSVSIRCCLKYHHRH